jgi:mannose-6-phosphate isomerase-like protein (cupin superfamily)
MRLAGWHRPRMAVYVWQQDLEPDFPLAVLEYVTQGDGDRMHWHDHLEVAVVIDGRGAFLFGRRALPAEVGDIFFIDNSQPHVALADPGTSLRLLLVLFRPELVAGPGCRELDLGYLAPFRVDERTASPRIRGGSALAAEVAPVLHELRAIWERHDPAERHLADATLRRALAGPAQEQRRCARPPTAGSRSGRCSPTSTGTAARASPSATWRRWST